MHGGFGTIEDINNLIPYLFTPIGIDSRGHGTSTMGTSPLTYECIQKDAELVLEHLNISTLSIIGFSDGGVVAYRLASFAALHIEKLLTIGSRWRYKNALATKHFTKRYSRELEKKVSRNF